MMRFLAIHDITVRLGSKKKSFEANLNVGKNKSLIWLLITEICRPRNQIFIVRSLIYPGPADHQVRFWTVLAGGPAAGSG